MNLGDTIHPITVSNLISNGNASDVSTASLMCTLFKTDTFIMLLFLSFQRAFYQEWISNSIENVFLVSIDMGYF